MRSFVRSSIIYLVSFLCVLNFGCYKNDNPAQSIPYKTRAVSFVTPKEGDIWIQNTLQKISWIVNKDSISPSVYVEYQKGINQPFKSFFLAQSDSLQRNIHVTLDTCFYYRLRIRGNFSDWNYSGVFSIRDNSFQIISPKEHGIYYRGDIVQIRLNVPVLAGISVDLSIDGGNTWQEVIKQNAALFWTVQSPSSNKCYVRIRDINGRTLAVSGQFEIVDLIDPNFVITSPKEGDILHQWAKISIGYINRTTIPVGFDFSSDDGNTWIQIIPSGSSPDWVITPDPRDNCKLRMRTIDTTLSCVSGRFRINSELDEFFPLQIGLILQYEYYHWSFALPWDTARYRYTIEINSSTIYPDSTIYACRVSYQNFYPNQDSSTVYTTFKEYNFGLHAISSRIAPFNYVPVDRYTPTPMSEKNDSYMDPNHDSGWYWTQKKGLGITSYGTWSGRQLNSKGNSYTLL